MGQANYVTILAILANMARCVNDNIGKVHLKPLDTDLADFGYGEANANFTATIKPG